MMINAATKLFRALDRELWIVTSQAGELKSGLVSTSLSQASIDEKNPRLTIGLSTRHLTSELVSESGRFVAHLVSHEQTSWIRHFGTQSGRDIDKFDTVDFFHSEQGIPILKDAQAWLECRVENVMKTGDRHWYLAEIVDSHWTESFHPLTFHNFLAQADDHLRALLKNQLEEDTLIDRRMIVDWRRSQTSDDR
ncbi:MAG: flavin reductase family protein [Planctomycetaceae bacterium]|nr:flavin reductase family protein [Planctomycetaceae bacterium]